MPAADARSLRVPFRFEWTVALRFLREGGMQTLLIVAGSTAGISVIVFMTGFLGDLQNDLIQRTLGVQPHVVIRAAEEISRPLAPVADDAQAMPQVQARTQRPRSVDQWQALRDRLEATPGIRAVSPVASGPGLVARGDTSKAVNVAGIVPDRYAAVTRLDEKMVAGEFRLGPGDALIGIDLAKDLGASVGDKIRISTATSAGDAYRITGIFDLGQRALNRANAFVTLPAAQALLALPGGVTSLELSIDDLFGAERLEKTLQAGMPHEVESWMRANSQLRAALNNQTVMTLLIRFFLAFVVAIGVASVLVVSVVQKTKEIGILRAMGTTRGRILRVFLLQGALIGAAGAILGSLAGYGLTAVMSRVVRADDGAALFQAQFSPMLYGYTIVVAIALGLAAAAMPARRAARLDPAQAIRL